MNCNLALFLHQPVCVYVFLWSVQLHDDFAECPCATLSSCWCQPCGFMCLSCRPVIFVSTFATALPTAPWPSPTSRRCCVKWASSCRSTGVRIKTQGPTQKDLVLSLVVKRNTVQGRAACPYVTHLHYISSHSSRVIVAQCPCNSLMM